MNKRKHSLLIRRKYAALYAISKSSHAALVKLHNLRIRNGEGIPSEVTESLSSIFRFAIKHGYVNKNVLQD